MTSRKSKPPAKTGATRHKAFARPAATRAAKTAKQTSTAKPQKTPKRTTTPKAKAKAQPPRERRRASIPIVGIGASAGGLEALEAFVRRIPPKSGAAYVIVQHLDPTHPAGLVALLQKQSAVPVVEITDTLPVQRNRVYVIPPGRELAVLHGALHLLDPVAPQGQRLTIDGFFRSLADEQGDRSVAVVLSGMGSDGLLGVEYLRDRGGVAFAQEPSTARFDSMPRALIDAGVADVVAAPDDMPDRIVELLARTARGVPRAETARAFDDGGMLEKISHVLRQYGGNDFTLYKRSTLLRRVERRMAVHQIDQPATYLRYLQRNPAEVGILFKELLIGVTSFFRDGWAWDVLVTRVLRPLIEAHQHGGVIRAWVPACSTGEEAYSLAIAFREALAQAEPAPPVTLQIFATDLNADAIAVARLGYYSASLEHAVDEPRRQRFFVRERGGYRIRKELRGMITFATHNVTTDPPFTRLDLVCCRNLLIYLTPEVQRRLIAQFHYALRPDGYLWLGTAESGTDPDGLFAVVDAKARLYRRRDRGARLSSREVIVPTLPGYGRDEEQRTGVRQPSLHTVASEFVLGHLGPAVLLADAQGEIVWLSERAQRYLVPGTGQATWNLAAMLEEPMRRDVLRGLQRAMRQTGLVELDTPLASEPDGRRHVTIRRLAEPTALEGLFLITITRPASTAADVPSVPGRRPTSAVARELREAREEAETARRALQAAREELGSALEEMQSANEELQSTNEELTTSKEELQSMNEELQTINAEQVARMEALSQAQSDMNNLLNSTQIATIFLGPAMTIRRFTAGAAEVYRLLPSDVGRPITDIVSDLPYPELVADARDVVRTLITRERERQAADGRWYLIRVMPYRTMDDMIDGAVVTFADVTRPKRLELSLRERERQLQAFVHEAPAAVLVLDAEQVVREANQQATRRFGRERDRLVGQALSALPLPRGFAAHVDTARRALAEGRATVPFTVAFIDADGTSHDTAWVAGTAESAIGGGMVLIGHEMQA